MKTNRATFWTIQQLSAEVARALAVDYVGARSGRIRDVPDLRTIRYYTTLGLLDRPAEMRARTALYGRRHMLQLVAIKKLQALGLSLAQVQQRMSGASEAMLVRLAGALPELSEDQESASRPQSVRNAAEPPFWKSRPAPVPHPQAVHGVSRQTTSSEDVRPSVVPAYEEVRPFQAIALADRTLLLLEAARPIDPEELAAIRQAAAPLMRHLREHQLTQSPPNGESDDPTASPVDRRGT
jgi:DNA-binding transcriptional MerR regulator